LSETTTTHAQSLRPVVRVTGYVLLALGFFVAGFLLLPLLEGEDGPALDLERAKLPRPVPVNAFVLDVVGENADPSAYTRERLLGRWTLMYFGYTQCPDVCRPTLAVLAEVARRLRAAMDRQAGVGQIGVGVRHRGSVQGHSRRATRLSRHERRRHHRSSGKRETDCPPGPAAGNNALTRACRSPRALSHRSPGHDPADRSWRALARRIQHAQGRGQDYGAGIGDRN
jgi:hypothetical protein